MSSNLQGLSKASIGLVVHGGCVDEGGGTASEEGRREKAIIPYDTCTLLLKRCELHDDLRGVRNAFLVGVGLRRRPAQVMKQE